MLFKIDQDHLLSSDVLASAALILILLAARILLGHAIKSRTNVAPHVVRRWTASLRNILLPVGLLGLVMIWAPQLRTFALSLTAVVVALVVATKELILCLSGSALRTFSRAYSVGDRIEVGGTRGEVLDHSLLVTTLQEFEAKSGSFSPTGRIVVLPNSFLFESPTRIESTPPGHAFHRFTITVEPTINVFRERHAVEQLVAKACISAGLMPSPASGKMGPQRQNGAAKGLPEIRFGTNEAGKYRIEIAVFSPVDQVNALENEITCAIGDHLHQVRNAHAHKAGDLHLDETATI